MELSSVFTTPKRKTRSSSTSSSSVETSPGEKRWKQSFSPASVSGKSNGSDEIMEALNHTEGVTEIRSYPFKAYQPGFEDGRIKPDIEWNTRQGLPYGDRDCLCSRQTENF